MTNATIHHAGPAPAEPAPQPAGLTSSPSQAIVADANAVIRTEPDARGRVFGIRRPNVLERMRLFEMMGADNVKNDGVMSIAAPAYMVVEIDGVAARRPITRRELDARVTQLGEEGLDAVTTAIAVHFGGDEAEKATSDAAEKAALKN